MLETFAKFKNWLALAAIGLVLSLSSYIYSADARAYARQQDAVHKKNDAQDVQIQQLSLAIERLKTLMEVQIQINQRLEQQGVARDSR